MIRPSLRPWVCLLAGAFAALGTPPLRSTLAPLAAQIVVALMLFEPDAEADRRSRVPGALRGMLFGVGVNFVSLRFVPDVVHTFTSLPAFAGYLALLLLALGQSLAWAVTGVVTRALHRLRVPFPLAFAFAVFAGTFVPAVFPWTMVSGLSAHPLLVQTADIFGERGVAVLWALICAGLVDALAGKRPGSLVLALAASAFMLRHGLVAGEAVDRAREASPHAKIALVQPGTDAKERWNEDLQAHIVERLHRLTREAEGKGAQLTIWPEAAYPFMITHGARKDEPGPRGILGDGAHGPVVAGLILRDMGNTYNSALLDDAGTLSQPYDKMRLLAFGEQVPLADQIPWLRKTFTRDIALAPGEHNVLLRHGPFSLGVLNCFEDTLTASGRDAARQGERDLANLLVNVTNDAWFYGSIEPDLHEQLSVVRAVETRLDFVRAVNRGPLSLVSASGKLLVRQKLDEPNVLLLDVALYDHEPTLYVRFGDGPMGLLFALVVAYGIVRTLRHGRTVTAGKTADASA